MLVQCNGNEAVSWSRWRSCILREHLRWIWAPSDDGRATGRTSGWSYPERCPGADYAN